MSCSQRSNAVYADSPLRVNAEPALACCQVRAVSSYLNQLTNPRIWLDAEFLKVLALGMTGRGSLFVHP